MHANRRAAGCLVCGLVLVLAAGTAGAQQVEIASTLNPVGSGARATGMGGAFIGVADDATAASWNPAGLTQLEKPEVSVVYSYFHRTQSYSSDVHPEIAGDNAMDASGVNYASVAYPFTLAKRNMIVSLSYQRLYEMNKDITFNYRWDLDGDQLDDGIKFKQEGFLYAISPAFAAMITRQLHLGVTVNFWDNQLGANGWNTVYESRGNGTLFGEAYRTAFEQKDSVSFSGANANLGLLWSLPGSFTVGMVYKTPFDAKLDKQSRVTSSQDLPDSKMHAESTTGTDERLTMRMPASYGAGLSWRPTDAWTVAFDVYRTAWSTFALTDSQGIETNPLNSRPTSEGRLKDTTQLRLGAEYLVIRGRNVFPVRCGIFSDPEPGTNRLDTFYGVSLGAGYASGRFAVDASYQYRAGKNLSGDVPAIEGSSADISQHSLMLSVIWYMN